MAATPMSASWKSTANRFLVSSEVMTNRLPSIAVVAISFLASAFVVGAQSGSGSIPRLPNGKPDFNGVWDHPRVVDITKDGKGCGALSKGCTQEGNGELSFTPAGLAFWKDEEHRFDYSARCM